MTKSAKRIRQIVGTTVVGVAGLGLAAGMLVWANTTELFPPTTFQPGEFAALGLQDLTVQTDDTVATTGLPSRTIEFMFNQEAGSSTDPLSNGSLDTLGDAVEDAVEYEPALYNIRGGGLDGNLKFTFNSVSPSDYVDGTYEDAFAAFQRVADADRGTTDFTSTVDNTGHRLVTVVVDTGSRSNSGGVLRSSWNNLVNDFPVNENITYKVVMKSGNVFSAEGVFTTEEEKDALATSDESIWNNIGIFIPQTTSNTDADNIPPSVFGVTTGKLVLSPISGSNKTTIVLTAPEGTDKAAFVSVFREKASQDPKVVFPSAVTTTFVVDGEATPFHVEYPSNREW
jgi:hypothetical protein